MIVEIGLYALVLALALSLVQATLPFWGARTRDARLMALARPVSLMQFALSRCPMAR
jgi:cytochrome c-type biogenesis protein CcmF